MKLAMCVASIFLPVCDAALIVLPVDFAGYLAYSTLSMTVDRQLIGWQLPDDSCD
jgi:hypothetical protein